MGYPHVRRNLFTGLIFTEEGVCPQQTLVGAQAWILFEALRIFRRGGKPWLRTSIGHRWHLLRPPNYTYPCPLCPLIRPFMVHWLKKPYYWFNTGVVFSPKSFNMRAGDGQLSSKHFQMKLLGARARMLLRARASLLGAPGIATRSILTNTVNHWKQVAWSFLLYSYTSRIAVFLKFVGMLFPCSISGVFGCGDFDGTFGWNKNKGINNKKGTKSLILMF